MLYAMAHDDEGFYEEHLNRFIGIAPTLSLNTMSYDEYVEHYQALENLGIYSMGGADQQEKYQLICDSLGIDVCERYAYLNGAGSVEGPIQSEMHYAQNGI